MKKFAILIVLMVLAACSGVKSEKYRSVKPAFDFQTYFTGPLKAWGLVQNRSGQVVQQFDVVMQGTWTGDKGELVEDFTYYDGKKQQRIWHLEKLANGRYSGRASDIIGVAEGETLGNAGNWRYTMNLPVGDSEYTVQFDDWMWQMNDGVIINRSYIKKWGFTVAELTIFMQKIK